MQKIVECKLVIDSEIDGKKDSVVIEGKGYYKNEEEQIIIYFSNDNNKYKFSYYHERLSISFNESIYYFKNNFKDIGIIKNGDLSLKITTLANELKLFDNELLVEYSLFQGDILIGKYKSKLSFK